MLERLAGVAPKVCELLEAAEEDLIAFYAFPPEHWTKLRSTNPLERVNKEIGRRTDVVGIFPNDAAVIRLAGALLSEQNDEWLVQRRYLSVESMALTLAEPRPSSLRPSRRCPVSPPPERGTAVAVDASSRRPAAINAARNGVASRRHPVKGAASRLAALGPAGPPWTGPRPLRFLAARGCARAQPAPVQAQTPQLHRPNTQEEEVSTLPKA